MYESVVEDTASLRLAKLAAITQLNVQLLTSTSTSTQTLLLDIEKENFID